MGRHWDSKRSRSRSPSKSTSSSSVRSSNHRDRDYKSRSSSHRYESSKFSSSRRDKDHHSSSRHRSRSRSPERHRDHHHRSRSPSHHKSKRSSKSPERVNRERVEDIIGQDINYKNFDMDEQQKRLEKIMQERRERIEKWRQQQKLGESSQINTNETSANDQENDSENVAAAVVPVNDIEIKKEDEPKKTWTLDDENDDDEDDENVDNVDETVEVDEENFQNPTATKIETEDKIEEVVKGKIFFLKKKITSYFFLIHLIQLIKKKNLYLKRMKRIPHR